MSVGELLYRPLAKRARGSTIWATEYASGRNKLGPTLGPELGTKLGPKIGTKLRCRAIDGAAHLVAPAVLQPEDSSNAVRQHAGALALRKVWGGVWGGEWGGEWGGDWGG